MPGWRQSLQRHRRHLDVDDGRLRHRAEFFLRQLAVVVVFARQVQKNGIGWHALARSLQRARAQ